MIKFGNLFEALPRSQTLAKEGFDQGKYKFFTSSPRQTKYVDRAEYAGPALIVGTGGAPNVHYCEDRFSTSKDCIVYQSKRPEVNLKYYYYYLLGNKQLLEKSFRGNIIRHTSRQEIEQIELPLPNLQLQTRIIDKLDKIHLLISTREASIDTLGQLQRALFAEIIGDPVTNPKKWPLVPLKEIINEFIVGKPFRENDLIYDDRLVDDKSYEDKHIVYDYFYVFETDRVVPKFIYPSIADSYSFYKHKITAGDIIICKTGVNIGKARVIDESLQPGIINQTLVKCSTRKEVMRSEVLADIFNNQNFRNKYLLYRAEQTTFPINLPSQRSLFEIKIPLPTRSAQEKYRKLIERINRLYTQMRASRHQLYQILEKALTSEVRITDEEREFDKMILTYTKQDFVADIRRLRLLLQYIQGNRSGFTTKERYDKAQQIVFDLLEDRKIVQQFNGEKVILKRHQ